MRLSPDEIIFWKHGFFNLNLTIVTTWALMLILVVASALVTRKLKTTIRISRWQSVLEMIVIGMQSQIKEIGLKQSRQYISFIGTLFLFIALSNSASFFLVMNRPPVRFRLLRPLLSVCSSRFRFSVFKKVALQVICGLTCNRP